MLNLKIHVSLLITLLIFANNAFSDHLPLWEVGVSLGGLNMPAYRGSEQHAKYLLPIPYGSYRGEKLRIGREGIKGFLFSSERWELDVSLYASPPVKSSESRARSGMDNLDATLEIGPSLTMLIYRSSHKKNRLKLELPLRAVIGSDLFHIDHHGWIFYPHLNLIRQHPPHGQDWSMSISAGIIYADDAYHDYFFGVDDDQVSAVRPSYQAGAGYSGARVSMNYRRYLSQEWVFRTFLQYENLNSVAFSDSPLKTADETFAAGFLISRIFHRSTTLVAH